MADPLVLSPLARRVFAAANLITAIVLVVLGFVVIKTRFWPIDLPLAAVALLLALSSTGLFARASWSERALLIAAWAAFGWGLLLIALIVLTIAFLRGVYGELSGVASATCALIVALAIPYVVLMPAVELVWLWRGRGSGR